MQFKMIDLEVNKLHISCLCWNNNYRPHDEKSQNLRSPGLVYLGHSIDKASLTTLLK